MLHYLVGDEDRLLLDMRYSLRVLYAHFNRDWDYPVVIFHDGLRPESRRWLIESAPNKLWFAFVEDYKKIPQHLQAKLPTNDFAGYPIGYRGMCRFRSGPIFMHPMLAGNPVSPMVDGPVLDGADLEAADMDAPQELDEDGRDVSR